MRSVIRKIGYFGPRLDAYYQTVLWNGIVEMAEERGTNLICFPGERIIAKENFEYQANILYTLACAENVDGLIILSTAIGILPSIEQVAQFCRSYAPIPVVSVGLLLPEIPSVVIDNEQGMTRLIEHLVTIHGFSRFAFISGPEKHQEVEIRLSAMTKTLKNYNLAIDPGLIVGGDLGQESGSAAIETLIGERKKNFDVVVAANDYMALGALENLKARGIKVPEEVAVVGFDDINSSSFCTPPLTTVFHPMHEEGRQALSILLDIIDRKDTPYHVIIPCHPVIRESCGCFSYKSSQTFPVAENTARVTGPFDPGAFKSDLIEKIPKTLGVFNYQDKKMITDRLLPELIDLFYRDIHDPESDEFIVCLNRDLRFFVDKGHDVISWHEMIVAIKQGMLAYCESETEKRRAESLSELALILIGELSRRFQGHMRTESERLSRNIWEMGNSLITSFDLNKLLDTIVNTVGRLGIERCYLSLYEKNESFPGTSRLFLAYDKGKKHKIEPGGILFPTRELIPLRLYPGGKNINMIVEPLYFRHDQLGLIVFEMNLIDTKVYDSLRHQISSALKGAFLMEEITNHAHTLSNEVSARTRELVEANKLLKDEIQQRKKIDAALKASERNFRKITEAAPIPLVLVRISDGSILYRSRHFSTTFGIEGKLKRNTKIEHFFLDPDYISEIFGKLKKESNLSDVELIALKADGVRLSVIASFQTITLAGEQCVLVGVYDITERKWLEKEILEISGREQRRIGQDLHDDLCQNLAGIAVMLSVLEKNIMGLDKKLAAKASSISQYINDTIIKTRNLARGLYPAALEENGLAYMLQELSANIQKQFGIPCFLSIDEKTVLDDISITLHLYRIAQEATNNSIRHGKPTHLEIDYVSTDDEVMLAIRDDGVGFPRGTGIIKGMGLRIMNYRANMIGAKLDLRPGPVKGVYLSCSLKRKE